MTNAEDMLRHWLKSKTNVALLVFLAIGGYFLFTEHRAHVIQALPFVLLLGCIGMHLFMHGGHGHGADHDNQQDDHRESRGD